MKYLIPLLILFSCAGTLEKKDTNQQPYFYSYSVDQGYAVIKSQEWHLIKVDTIYEGSSEPIFRFYYEPKTLFK